MTTMQASGVTVTPHTNYGKAAGEMVPLGHSSRFDLDRAGGKTANSAAADLRAMFGDTMTVVPTMAYDLDAKAELAHNTTGLKYAIRGRASVIEAKVGERLASFKDPIKSVLPVRVVDTHRVIVVQKEVVGGRSIIAPERAPARTVGVKETVREVLLERYGGDLEMNLNLQHTPAAFKEELDLKINAQQRELERVLIEIGYDTLLQGGLRLETAILRSSPAFNHSGGMDPGGADGIGAEARRIYNDKCFGVVNRSAFPLQQILSAAKYASAYSVGAPGSVLILPHGLPELLRYGRPEPMTFNISGLKTTDNKPITMELGTAHTDPATSIKMVTHIPLPTFEYGTATPNVGQGCLSQTVTIYDTIPANTPFVNLKKRTLEPQAGGVRYRKTVIVMGSAILAAPGSDTGELLVGFPHTGVSTSQTDETMKMQLRVYLGAVLKRPESAIILPDIVCEGIVSCAVDNLPAGMGTGDGTCSTLDAANGLVRATGPLSWFDDASDMEKARALDGDMSYALKAATTK